MLCNNPNLDLVNMNAYLKFGEILSICPQDIERKQNPERNSDIDLSRAITLKMMFNNSNQDHLVDINTYTKFGEILPICNEAIERKRNIDGQTDGMTDNLNPV